jgi:hypothetical protein
MTNRIDDIKDKANSFFESKKAVHIKLKDGLFRNGEIKEIGTDFFILIEFVFGEVAIFYRDVDSIELYTLKRKEDGTRG